MPISVILILFGNFTIKNSHIIIKKISLGILVVFSLSLLAQPPLQINPGNPALFEWTEMPSIYAVINTSVAASDGGWVVGGRYWNTDAYSVPPVVIKLSSTGEKLWQYPQSFEWETGSTDVIKHSNDGNLFVSGRCRMGCYYDPIGTFLNKISEDGQLIWKKIFITDNTFSVGEVFEAANGDIYVLAGPQMLKVSANGDSLLTQFFPMIFYDVFASGLATEDFLLLGHLNGIYKTDFDGNIISIHEFIGPVSNITRCDNGYVFNGVHLLIKTDEELNTVDELDISTIIPKGFQATVKNEKFIIAGNNHILQVDFDFQIIADNTYENSGNFEVTDISVEDNIILLAGNNEHSSNEMVMAAKTYLLDGTSLNPSVDAGIVNLRAENIIGVKDPNNPHSFDLRWDAFATLKNFGNDTINSINFVSVMLENIICSERYYQIPQSNMMLYPGDSIEITLGEMQEFNLYCPNPTIAEYTLKMHTMLPNGFMDRNPANDEASITFLVDLTVGIDENPVSEIRIFPNPASGFINIEMPANDVFSWVITSITGQKILNGSSYLDNTKVDVSSLPKGLYFIEISKSGRKISVEKLLISG
jgi:hypothetical protein